MWSSFIQYPKVLKFQQRGRPQTLELTFISKLLALSKIAQDPRAVQLLNTSECKYPHYHNLDKEELFLVFY